MALTIAIKKPKIIPGEFKQEQNDKALVLPSPTSITPLPPNTMTPQMLSINQFIGAIDTSEMKTNVDNLTKIVSNLTDQNKENIKWAKNQMVMTCDIGQAVAGLDEKVETEIQKLNTKLDIEVQKLNDKVDKTLQQLDKQTQLLENIYNCLYHSQIRNQ
ncbi:hypothetical protein SAMD00019534_032750 [Acytostelium subglobosum LB1]|uniref:hypothetical protein n=1 Tax=Acytostelium subglobosum LB1 TaxID=1410327 RepID=UPI0006451481|nr:hypothetical protein SAMD00019534_032750 [Acytostelium subglobosum LB1]GAM20100.1 hypothetical protein SAMD00019534_032750 [Acytostelium subglobosum LB1]|eukprot:XP_012756862.1 hypothetical protein SAMD00019534_032750 [Acytostelium subglobosum LB1]